MSLIPGCGIGVREKILATPSVGCEVKPTYTEKKRTAWAGSKIKLYYFSQFFSSANANDNKVNNAALFLAIYVGRFFVAHLLGFQSNRRDVCYCYHGFLSVLL